MRYFRSKSVRIQFFLGLEKLLGQKKVKKKKIALMMSNDNLLLAQGGSVLNGEKFVLRVDRNLYFPAVDRFRNALTKAAYSESSLRTIVIDFALVTQVDYTSLKVTHFSSFKKKNFFNLNNIMIFKFFFKFLQHYIFLFFLFFNIYCNFNYIILCFFHFLIF